MEESTEQTGGGSNTKLEIWLSAEEHAELRRAVSEGGLPNTALLVFQAIHEGLEDDKPVGVQKRRTRLVTIHVSKKFKEKIRLRARTYRVTQQALLRALLFHYIRNKPWQNEQAEKAP